ncbi:MAG: MFS transporter, partial [Candidatus Omnitrophica bacterium]|nr:MFS transporter [Candidatus Omnitrophota bacterium]
MFLRQRLKSWSSILSWCMYDLANQFFAVNVVSLYFVRWLTIEKNAPEFFYSISFGISIFAVAVLAPFLGAISDESGKRKPFLSWLTLISVIFTILLGVGNSVFLALLFFAIANFGCQLAVVFYNTLLVDIAPKNR